MSEERNEKCGSVEAVSGKCGCKAMRILRRCAIGVVVVLCVLFLIVEILLSQLTPIVNKTLDVYGPKMLGAEVSVQKVDFSLFRTRFEMIGLVVGNPEGFNTDNAFELSRVLVKVKPTSLFTDTVVVTQVLVEEPKVTYEMGLGNSNFGTLLENMNNFSGAVDDGAPKDSGKPSEAVESPSEGGKKVVIEEVKISGGKVRLSAKFLQGVAASIPLPTISMHDIGKSDGKEEGVSYVDATRRVLTGFFTSVIDVGKAGFSAMGDITKDAGEAIADAAKATGKAIGDAAKSAGKAIGDGAEKAFDAVKGIFGGDEEKKK